MSSRLFQLYATRAGTRANFRRHSTAPSSELVDEHVFARLTRARDLPRSRVGHARERSVTPMDETTTELRDLCALLDGEPLFHASLGSKELFHSNMLEWFTTHHREAAAQAFDSWTSPSPGTPWQRTQREWRHLDLVVHLAERAPLVIENKVF